MNCVAQRVNFNKLDCSALKRYKRHYKLVDVVPNPSKEQLAHAVAAHFMTQVKPLRCRNASGEIVSV